MVTAGELVKVWIFDNSLTEEEKSMVSFDLYLNDKKGNHSLGFNDFMEFMDSCGIAKDSVGAAQLEMGVEAVLPEGRIRMVRTAPTDEYIESRMEQSSNLKVSINRTNESLETPEEEIRDIAKRLIWTLTSNYEGIRDHNPHFNKGFVSLLEYMSAVTCDDWPAESMKTFSGELEHSNFIRYIRDDHSKLIFQRFAEVCSKASGINDVDSLMDSCNEVKAWPTLSEYRALGLERGFLRYAKGFIERYIASGHLYLKRTIQKAPLLPESYFSEGG